MKKPSKSSETIRILNIRQLLRIKGMHQQHVAEKMDIGAKTLRSKIDDIKRISLSEINQLSFILQICRGDLIDLLMGRPVDYQGKRSKKGEKR